VLTIIKFNSMKRNDRWHDNKDKIVPDLTAINCNHYSPSIKERETQLQRKGRNQDPKNQLSSSLDNNKQQSWIVQGLSTTACMVSTISHNIPITFISSWQSGWRLMVGNGLKG
jgi:hypothetical protein